MKTLLNICSAAGFTCVLWLAGSDFLPSSPSAEVTSMATGSRSRNQPMTAAAFKSHAQSKVVQYFDTFRAEPMGLPPGHAAQFKVGEIPASWATAGIARGVVVLEAQRSALVEAPAELVRVLPTRQPAVRYYLAGSNLVAVDSGYKVIDSIRIPTVRLPSADESVAEVRPLQLVQHLDPRNR